jgi:hypothetical protein
LRSKAKTARESFFEIRLDAGFVDTVRLLKQRMEVRARLRGEKTNTNFEALLTSKLVASLRILVTFEYGLLTVG